MRGGDSVYDAYSAGKAHCFREVRNEIAVMECGRRIKASRLVSNRGRREPCAKCAAAIERRQR